MTRSITWHQWHQVAPLSKRISLSSRRARSKTASLHGSQWISSFAVSGRAVTPGMSGSFFGRADRQAGAAHAAHDAGTAATVRIRTGTL